MMICPNCGFPQEELAIQKNPDNPMLDYVSVFEHCSKCGTLITYLEPDEPDLSEKIEGQE
jgi:hypothetical protein